VLAKYSGEQYVRDIRSTINDEGRHWGVITAHGEEIPDQFTIVPEFMDIYLSGSSGSLTSERLRVMAYLGAKNQSYRVYKGGALIPNFELDFNLVYPHLPGDDNVKFSPAGIFPITDPQEWIVSSQVRASEGGMPTMDDVLFEHDESYIKKEKIKKRKKDIRLEDKFRRKNHDRLRGIPRKHRAFNLAEIFKLILKRNDKNPEDTPQNWIGHFCRMRRGGGVNFSIKDLEGYCGIEKEGGELPDDFFSEQMQTLLSDPDGGKEDLYLQELPTRDRQRMEGKEVEKNQLRRVHSLARNVRTQNFSNMIKDIISYLQSLRPDSELSKELPRTEGLYSKWTKEYETLDTEEVCDILRLYNKISSDPPPE
jgi:hypothetical protein